MDKLYIVIPAYNEQDNIELVVNDWYPIIEKHNGNGQSRLVIIDDGSKDSTYEKLKQYACVLIETLWNVNVEQNHVYGFGQFVLIETLWNVN